MQSEVKLRLIEFLSYLKMGQKAFAESVGLSAGFVNSIRVSIQPKTMNMISEKYPMLNTAWLLTGKGKMLVKETDENDGDYGCTRPEVQTYTTYLLPISSRGGTLTGFSAPGTTLENCEKIVSPIADVDFAISIYGESMSPEYPSGSTVLIKKVDPSLFIEWGKVFVLDTPNGVILKEIHECKGKDGYVTCHSINPDPKFADFDVPLREVYGMYRVLMCLSVK